MLSKISLCEGKEAMKNRLKKKLKAKKILGNKGHTFVLPTSKPKPAKKVYEMPPEYQANLQKLAERIELRDLFVKDLAMMLPHERREAQQKLFKFNEAIEKLEQVLANEYDEYQEEQFDIDVSALTNLEEGMSEEHFIRVKHLQPELFDEFERRVTEGMTDAERRVQYAIIARREAEELDAILSGELNAAPYENIFIKHRLPDNWMSELLLDIINGAYETDEFFDINYEALERASNMIFQFRFHVDDAMPVQRRNMEEAFIDLRRQFVAGAKFLLEHVEKCLANGDFLAKETVYVKGIEDDFATLARCREWKYVIIKHTEPEKLAEYTRIVTEDFSPEETAAFLKSVAECDEKDADSLLESLEYERLNEERVARYRRERTETIKGAQLSERQRQNFERTQRNQQERLKKHEDESNVGIEYDLPDRLAPFLKAFHAVTGDRISPARYEDEQSRKDEEMSQLLAGAMRNMEKLYIIIKHQTPEKFAEFEKVLEPLSRIQRQEFYARIAHLEATQLDEILDGKK